MHTVGHTHINTLIILCWIFCRYIVLEGSQYTKSSRFICIHGEDPNQLIWLTLLVRWLYNWLGQLIWWYNIIVWYDVIRVTWNQDWWFMAGKGVINWDKSLIYMSPFSGGKVTWRQTLTGSGYLHVQSSHRDEGPGTSSTQDGFICGWPGELTVLVRYGMLYIWCHLRNVHRYSGHKKRKFFLIRMLPWKC